MSNISDKNFLEVAIFGKSAVKAAFELRKNAISKLFLTPQNRREFSEICEFFARERRSFEILNFEKISEIVGNKIHEGVLAVTRRPLPSSIKPAIRDEWSSAVEKIIFVDEGVRSREIAKIARISALCGISRLVVSEKILPEIFSAEAWSLAEGALETLKIYATESMPSLLKMMGERFFVVGMVREGGRKIDYSKQISFPGKPVALYLSGNPNGVPAENISRCGHLFHIPEATGTKFFYAPDELAAHILPWIYAKIKKPGNGFLARKKAAQKK